MPEGFMSPSKKAAKAGIPGIQNVRPAPDSAKISLFTAMGRAFKTLGDEMMKGLEADPTEMAKAKAMIVQVQRASQGPQRPSPEDMGPTERPMQADQAIDPMTGMQPGQMVGPSTPRTY